MKYFIIHPDPICAEAAAKTFRRRLLGRHASSLPEHMEGYDVAHDVIALGGKLEDLVEDGFACDAIIAPGNSYGDMTSGFDRAIVNVTGDYVQQMVHARIAQCFFGEMNVGQADLLPLNKGPFRYLAYAPTVRVPRPLASTSDAPYVSTLAALQAIHRFNRGRGPEYEYQPVGDPQDFLRIGSVVMTLHGQGVGRLPFSTVAFRMAKAIEQIHFPMRRTILSARDHDCELTGRDVPTRNPVPR